MIFVKKDYQVYNPKAVVSVMLKDKFRSHWSETGSYEAVAGPIDQYDFDGLKTAIIEMLAGNAIEVDGTFQNDMNNFIADDVLTYLIHLGYLALTRQE